MSNARFSILQAIAVSDRRVSDAQFRTLAALGMYADKNGWCFPSLKTLAADLKKSPQAVGRDTIALRKLGYLEVKNRYDAKTKSRHSNLYRLKYDLPDFNMDDTPLSTSEVDTLSTSEVDVNDPKNDPMNTLLSFEKMKAGKEAESWKGRETFAPQDYTLVDWYHNVTGQDCPKSKSKDWHKAIVMWSNNNLTVEHLQAAYDMDVKWRGVFTSPNQLTDKAIALKAKGIRKTDETKGGYHIQDIGEREL
jgi:hypothetical protein